jgi:hypothetical protein
MKKNPPVPSREKIRPVQEEKDSQVVKGGSGYTSSSRFSDPPDNTGGGGH